MVDRSRCCISPVPQNVAETWPSNSRRNTLLSTKPRFRRGVEPLSEEIVFLGNILRSNKGRREAILLASSLIRIFGSLITVLAADADDLAAIPGVGRENAAAVKQAHSTIIDVVNSSIPAKPLLNQTAMLNMIIWTIGESPVEKVLLIYLDKVGHHIGHEVVCIGNESTVSVSPKVIVSSACRRSAAALVIAHNHPGGSVEPSDADLILTRKLVYAARVLDIKIVDHVIVSGTRHFSFREIGLI